MGVCWLQRKEIFSLWKIRKRYVQGPPWQSGYFKLTRTGTKMQFRFCVKRTFKKFIFFINFFPANPVELVIVESDPNDAQMMLNVVNISNFFLLSGQIKAESNSHDTEEMSGTSFKLDQHFGIIEGIYMCILVLMKSFPRLWRNYPYLM